jgi:hypothetical protein
MRDLFLSIFRFRNSLKFRAGYRNLTDDDHIYEDGNDETR